MAMVEQYTQTNVIVLTLEMVNAAFNIVCILGRC